MAGRSTYYPAIYVGSILSFDASLGVPRGRTWPLWWEVARKRGVRAVVLFVGGQGWSGYTASEEADSSVRLMAVVLDTVFVHKG